MILTMTRHHVRTMVDHVLDGLPYEACGLLGGRDGRVMTAYKTRNADKRRNRFLVNPDDHYHALQDMDTKKEELIGIFHSHPGGDPTPSTRDRQYAAYPGVAHVIIAVADRVRMRAFLLDNRQQQPVRMLIGGSWLGRLRLEYSMANPRHNEGVSA